MKKIIFAFLILVLLVPETSEASAPISKSNTLKESQLLKRKKGYRRKKGFLWGLFRKRNACDCPKH